MLKISGRTKLIFSIFVKSILAMCIGCIAMFALLFISYKPVYEVELNGEKLGYINNKKTVQENIMDFLQNGDSEKVGYVILSGEPTYEFRFVKKENNVDDEAVVAKVKSECEIYYRIYGINVDNEEKFVVETIKEAQEITDKINNEQEKYDIQSKVEISEKFVQKYDLLDDVEVVVNDIVDKIEEENKKVTKKATTYAASSYSSSVGKVPESVLLALREANIDLTFRNPLDTGIVTSRYGLRSLGNHKGLDIGAPVGTPIHAAESGVVTFAGWYGGYGYLMKVQHAGGYETYYGHCSKFKAKVGDEVEKGDVIAYVGNTGRSTGPHLHLEVRIDGVAYNPEQFLSE